MTDRDGEVLDVDCAVVGAGAAGLSLAVHLDRLVRARPGAAAPSLALVDPVHRRGDDRTWCFWDAGTSPVEEAVERSWRRVELVDRAGRSRVLDLGPLRYALVRSSDFYALADAAASRLGAVRVTAPADEVTDGAVRAGGRLVRARWIVDSRPAPPRLRANTAVLQHFRGWVVRLPHDAFDPGLPVLMDFSVPQPRQGVAFGYVLPTGPRRALVEYTEFSRARLPEADYDRALRAYLLRRYRTAVGAGGAVLERVEDGAIPMTDAVHDGRPGPRLLRAGTAGGATRGSTGYTFAAVQRQAAAVAADLLAGRDPAPPPAYPRRHRWMDAVLLRALDRGLAPGPELLTGIFDHNPPDRVLRFLDGRTAPWEELLLMSTAPLLPMARASVGDLAARAGRRLGRAAQNPSAAPAGGR